MRREIGPVLSRKHPIALRRAFHLKFGVRARRQGGDISAEDGRYRARVSALLDQIYGVPLPPSLRSLADGARRRSISAAAMVAFLAELFDLEPLSS